MRTADRETLEEVWPAVMAALEWIDRYGDRDGDGLVEYGRQTDSGLRNQGWKDSEDALFHADGRLAAPPIALAEVQGYVYLARRLAASMAADLGERADAAKLESQATTLREQFEARFWCEDLQVYTSPWTATSIRAGCESNAGQALFWGSPARSGPPVRTDAAGTGLFSGWGIVGGRARGRYNPASYHNGSVRPHDNALIALGLARYGNMNAVLRLTTVLFEAAYCMDLRDFPNCSVGSGVAATRRQRFIRSPVRRRPGPRRRLSVCSRPVWAWISTLLHARSGYGIRVFPSF